MADMKTLLYCPDEDIVIQGQPGDSLYFIAYGECEIWIKDEETSKK